MTSFKSKTKKNLIFHAERGQEKTNPKLTNEPEMCKQTRNLEIYPRLGRKWASLATGEPTTREQTQSSQTE